MNALTDRKGFAASRAAASIRSFFLWTMAVVLSFALNIALFGLMPALMDKNPDKPHVDQYVSSINVIRMKRHETPPKKKKHEEKITKKEPEKKRLIKEPVYTTRPKMKNPPKLPFKINARLPAISTDFHVPDVEMVAVDAPDLKPSYGVGEIDHPLTPIVRVPPIYPLRARRRGIEGWVRIRFIVNKDGTVSRIEILESKPKKIFDAAVKKCVERWRFSPGTVEGIPVKTRVETTVKFKLEK